MTNNQGEIFRKYIKSNDIAIEDIVQKAGISRQTVHTWYKVAEFTPNQLAKLEKAGIGKEIFTNVSSRKGKLTPVINKSDINHTTENEEGELKELTAAAGYRKMKIPLVRQYAYAGYLSGYADEEYVQQLETVEYMVDKEYKGKYLCFEVKGDSMDDGSYDAYKQGNVVMCREVSSDLWKNSKLHINAWDFIIVHDESIVLKQIINHDVEAGTITVHSRNPFYEDYTINLADVKQIFNVIKVTKDK